MGENHEYPLRLHAKDCDYYMRNGTCKFKMNCKYNHPIRRPNQEKKEKEVSVAHTSNSAHKRPYIPKFGSWENNEGVPYTMCFENARNGCMEENMINSDYHHRIDGKDNEPKQYAESLSDYNARATGIESSHQRYIANALVSNEIPKGLTRPNTAFENKIDLPEQANGLWRDVNPPTPSQEGKNLYMISSGTPGGSKMNPSTQGNSSPDKGATIPKFGLWNIENSESGSDYTAIFYSDTTKVEEQNGERTRAQMDVKGSVSPSNDIQLKQNVKRKTKIHCFPWFKK